MPTSDDVEAVFKRLLPEGTRVVAAAVADAPNDWPLPLELKKARVARQREFIAGRWCAQRALTMLGATGEIGRAASRAATWPVGVTGSISHTRELAVAAVTRLTAVGIDLEPKLSDDALRDLRASAIDDAEWQVLGQSTERAAALFSAKEAIFKCEHPRTGVFLEFTDAKLRAVSAESMTFVLSSGELSVRYALEHGNAFTAVWRD